VINKKQKSCHADHLNFGAGGPGYKPGLVSKDHFYHDVRIMAVRPPELLGIAAASIKEETSIQPD